MPFTPTWTKLMQNKFSPSWSLWKTVQENITLLNFSLWKVFGFHVFQKLFMVFNLTANQGTAQGNILSGDDLGRCQARNTRCWGDPGHIKQAVLLSICTSICPFFHHIHLWAEGTFRCSRRLQPSAGVRKKPPVEGLNLLVVYIALPVCTSLLHEVSFRKKKKTKISWSGGRHIMSSFHSFPTLVWLCGFGVRSTDTRVISIESFSSLFSVHKVCQVLDIIEWDNCFGRGPCHINWQLVLQGRVSTIPFQKQRVTTDIPT